MHTAATYIPTKTLETIKGLYPVEILSNNLCRYLAFLLCIYVTTELYSVEGKSNLSVHPQ